MILNSMADTLNGPARGVDVPRNAQIGNAIPPLVGRAFGKALSYLDELIQTDSRILDQYRVINEQLNLSDYL